MKLNERIDQLLFEVDTTLSSNKEFRNSLLRKKVEDLVYNPTQAPSTFVTRLVEEGYHDDEFIEAHIESFIKNTFDHQVYGMSHDPWAICIHCGLRYRVISISPHDCTNLDSPPLASAIPQPGPYTNCMASYRNRPLAELTIDEWNYYQGEREAITANQQAWRELNSETQPTLPPKEETS